MNAIHFYHRDKGGLFCFKDTIVLYGDSKQRGVDQKRKKYESMIEKCFSPTGEMEINFHFAEHGFFGVSFFFFTLH